MTRLVLSLLYLAIVNLTRTFTLPFTFIFSSYFTVEMIPEFDAPGSVLHNDDSVEEGKEPRPVLRQGAGLELVHYHRQGVLVVVVVLKYRYVTKMINGAKKLQCWLVVNFNK